MLFRRYFKAQRDPEPFRLPDPEGDAEKHPNASDNFGRVAQIQPEREADEKTEHGRKEIEELLLWLAGGEEQKKPGPYSPESDQRAQNEQFRPEAPAVEK